MKVPIVRVMKEKVVQFVGAVKYTILDEAKLEFRRLLKIVD